MIDDITDQRDIFVNVDDERPMNDEDVKVTVLDLPDPHAVEATVTGLPASTEYDVRVGAYGHKGLGQLSRSRRVRTKDVGELLEIRISGQYLLYISYSPKR